MPNLQQHTKNQNHTHHLFKIDSNPQMTITHHWFKPQMTITQNWFKPTKSKPHTPIIHCRISLPITHHPPLPKQNPQMTNKNPAKSDPTTIFDNQQNPATPDPNTYSFKHRSPKKKKKPTEPRTLNSLIHQSINPRPTQWRGGPTTSTKRES